jgi:hypothetical protein
MIVAAVSGARADLRSRSGAALVASALGRRR